jgi:hypothetical protein
MLHNCYLKTKLRAFEFGPILNFNFFFEIPNQNPTEIKLMRKWNLILEVGRTGGKFHKFHNKHPLERPTFLVFGVSED